MGLGPALPGSPLNPPRSNEVGAPAASAQCHMAKGTQRHVSREPEISARHILRWYPQWPAEDTSRSLIAWEHCFHAF